MVFRPKQRALGVGSGGEVRQSLPLLPLQAPPSPGPPPPVQCTIQAATGVTSLKGDIDLSVCMTLLLKTPRSSTTQDRGGVWDLHCLALCPSPLEAWGSLRAWPMSVLDSVASLVPKAVPRTQKGLRKYFLREGLVDLKKKKNTT